MSVVFAQRKSNNPPPSSDIYAESSTRDAKLLDQRMKRVKKGKKKFKASNIKETAVKFRKKRLKESKKELRELKKPQYSNPTYFGHKRPPKKRPVGKRKLCKECGIVH